MHRTILPMLALLAVPVIVHGQDKRPLNHDGYDIWKTIDDQAISRDGRWVLYSLVLQEGDAELRVQSLEAETTYIIPRGTSARFTHDSRFVVALIRPELTLARDAQRRKKKPEDQPQDSLAIVNLRTGAVERVARVKSYQMPEEAAGWLAYLEEQAADETTAAPGEAEQAAAAEERQPTEEAPAKKDKKEGTPLVLRQLDSGMEQRFQHVAAYSVAKSGRYMSFVVSTKSGAGDAVFVVEPGQEIAVEVLSGPGEYRSLTFDEEGEQLAFLSNRDAYESEQPAFTLYHWGSGDQGATVVAAEGTAGLPAGWWVSEHASVSFSKTGRRLFFATAPRPQAEVEDSLLDEERVVVDVWHWQDPLLQPMQQVRLNQERNRSYRAVVHLSDGRVVQLADEQVPEIAVGRDGNVDVAVGTSNLPYRHLISWEYPQYRDVYEIDVRSGARRRVLEKIQSEARLSPNGKYVVWWDNQRLTYVVKRVGTKQVVNVSQHVPFPLHNEDHDWPHRPFAYGTAGWTDGDREVLVYDRYDIWALDPEGQRPPRNVTEGAGRRDSLRFRYVRLDPERESISPTAPMLLSAFNRETKEAGFYRDRVRGDQQPERLVYMPRRFSNPVKARDADVLLFTRESISEFPNLWVSGLGLRNMRKVSDANPQQGDYIWATVELVEWKSADGIPLRGLLYKPENFDPSRQYPMVVNFYERDSDNLYRHYPPIPHRSVIRPVFYASRGYVVFMPDVKYQVGYPGESALDAVVPGVLSVVKQGFVDPENIGVQGHSWGGYQIAYMVTKTNLFRAAAGGAPVANMISAYGGIRWGSGMSRMFQYEMTQSRIGATLWEAPIRYIENSPIFWADKVETPLLMMHNDKDHAVPWYQGIEMFVALRRLGKPAWLINYNDELHWPQDYHERRDWNVRMQQFFDHYLQGARPPVWLAEGIPAVEKGTTLGLDLVDERMSATGGGK